MCEKEWITAPSAMITPGPITTNGSIVTSLPNSVSAARKTVSGAISVTPASIACFAQPRLHDAFGFGELRLGVDAAHFVFAGFDHNGLQSQIPDNSDGIDQIIFALAVRIADPVENFQGVAAVERHHPGIAQRDLALFRAGVGLFADRDQPVALPQEPAVAGRIGGVKAENRERRARFQRRAHPPEGLGRYQRRVAEGDQEIVGAALDRRARRQHRMRRAQPLALDKGLGIGAEAAHLVGDRLVVGPDHDGEARSLRPWGAACEHMREQRLAGHRMQHLGQRGAHARALAGREHDSQTGTSVHPIPWAAA